MRRSLALILCFSVAGCFTAGKRGGDSAMAIYDFGPLPAKLTVAPRAQAMALEVRAPLWFDTLGIDYRLAYIDAARLREYARARWAGPPAQLIQQQLMQRLDLSMAGQAQARCLLRVEITEFSQVFQATDSSKAVLQGKAMLFDRARRQLAEFPINIEIPAPSQDARGGVAALSASVTQLGDELGRWEALLKAGGNPGGCAS